MKVIEAGLANRTDARIVGQCGELRAGVVRSMMDITWMNADAGVNARALCQRQIGLKIL